MAAVPTGNGGDTGMWTVIVNALGVAFQVMLAIVGAAWALGRSKTATDDKIAEKDRALTTELIGLERRVENNIDQATRQFGETAAALRQKITETELWNRDNFVNKKTFDTVIGEIKRAWEQFEARLDVRLDRFEDKLDNKERD